jgi:hypothetical protein
MTKYIVHAVISHDIHYTVDADDPKEAERKLKQLWKDEPAEAEGQDPDNWILVVSSVIRAENQEDDGSANSSNSNEEETNVSGS